jgi:hypothetical protein
VQAPKETIIPCLRKDKETRRPELLARDLWITRIRVSVWPHSNLSQYRILYASHADLVCRHRDPHCSVESAIHVSTFGEGTGSVFSLAAPCVFTVPPVNDGFSCPLYSIGPCRAVAVSSGQTAANKALDVDGRHTRRLEALKNARRTPAGREQTTLLALPPL